jgi:signal recognition particle GTPase
MLGSLREKLARTRNAFRKVEDLFRSGKRREDILEGLEEALVQADVGVTATERIVAEGQDEQGRG